MPWRVVTPLRSLRSMTRKLSGTRHADRLESCWEAPSITDKGLRDLFRQLHEPWDSYEDHLEELIDAGGEEVITVVTTRGRGRATGIEVEQRHQAAVWTIRNQKVVRVVWFATRAEALEATGLTE